MGLILNFRPIKNRFFPPVGILGLWIGEKRTAVLRAAAYNFQRSKWATKKNVVPNKHITHDFYYFFKREFEEKLATATSGDQIEKSGSPIFI